MSPIVETIEFKNLIAPARSSLSGEQAAAGMVSSVDQMAFPSILPERFMSLTPAIVECNSFPPRERSSKCAEVQAAAMVNSLVQTTLLPTLLVLSSTSQTGITFAFRNSAPRLRLRLLTPAPIKLSNVQVQLQPSILMARRPRRAAEPSI